jgi:hypothetical protein
MSSRSVRRSVLLSVTPFPRSETPTPLPGDVRLVCDCEFWDGIANESYETYYLQSSPAADPATAPDNGTSIDTLWASGLNGDPAPVATAGRQGDDLSSAILMFDALLEGRAGYGWPHSVIRSGLIDQILLDQIKKRVTRRLDARRRTVVKKWGGAPIVKAASKLHLNAEPHWRTPSAWRANCPGGQHSIQIDASRNEFFCGYCRQKGGVSELRAFVALRTKGGVA